MNAWARRPESETPRMEQRMVKDGRGRTWVGNVRSGAIAGGERRAEVVFVCVDQPGELKRVGRLEVGGGRAGDVWRNLEKEEVEGVFRRSEPA